MTDRRDAEAGFALITVLWAVILISVFVILILRSGTGDSLALTHDQEDRQARALALGEANHIMAQMIAGEEIPIAQEVALPRKSGKPIHLTALFPEVSKLDVNRADATLIRAVLEESGMGQIDARETAERIVNYRATVAPFQDIRELESLGFVSAATFRILAPALTRYGGTVIDARYLPDLLQRSLRRLKPSDRQAFFHAAEAKDKGLTAGNYRLDQTITMSAGREFDYHTIIRFRPGFATPAEIIEHRPGNRSPDGIS
ncbi:helix-hairpin-helix domain-containing protein [Emcibacter nanhaiensis]|uniref:Helix-hairpin-helix domain-containing protein n=1 Tax=Emcibacter nanhaiensis TaxID=1505037 RepID=A0A501PIW9_9PROT|nr:helix-hairpin-helix domain-containing protein [Emcibacter nanhaiensis]TPD60165.1 helix-hairpin-helix domain-containing protein [Emcibacter nanhaiensis]